MIEFLQQMTEELERQVEMREAEVETLQAGMRKGKKDTAKAEAIHEHRRGQCRDSDTDQDAVRQVVAPACKETMRIHKSVKKALSK